MSQETEQQKPGPVKAAPKKAAQSAPKNPEDLPLWPGAAEAEPGKVYRTLRGSIIKA